MSQWNAGRIILALANYFQWHRNHMFTEYEIDGGRADLVFISPAGYVTEIEIKVSRSDWAADRWKAKFERPRPHISRFYYAVPSALVLRIPSDIVPSAGILSIQPVDPSYRGHFVHDRVHEVRTAKRLPATKLSACALQDIYRSCYYRYWHQQIGVLMGRRLHNEDTYASAKK